MMGLYALYLYESCLKLKWALEKPTHKKKPFQMPVCPLHKNCILRDKPKHHLNANPEFRYVVSCFCLFTPTTSQQVPFYSSWLEFGSCSSGHRGMQWRLGGGGAVDVHTCTNTHTVLRSHFVLMTF